MLKLFSDMSYHSYSRKKRRLPEPMSGFSNVEEFLIIEELGHGGYSNVYLVEHKKSGKRYALKCAFKYKKGKNKSRRTYMEIKVLQKLEHKNVISLKGWFEDDDTIYLVLELIKGKDLTKFFNIEPPSKEQIKFIFRQLIEALLYTHNKKVIHRDLKLENILIDDDLNIKLTDFGLCTIKKDDFSIFSTKLGTVRYSAPEMLMENDYNESIDIWAIGIILFKLITGKYPFDGSTKSKIFRRIQYKKINWSKYYLERKEENLLRKLLKKDPYQRIEIEDILNHSYFN